MSEEGARTYCVERLKGVVDPIHLGTRERGCQDQFMGARMPRITALRSSHSKLIIGFPVPVPASKSQLLAVPCSSLSPLASR